MSHGQPNPRPRQISIQLAGGLNSRTRVAGLNGGEYLCYLDVCHRCFPPFPCIFLLVTSQHIKGRIAVFGDTRPHTARKQRERGVVGSRIWVFFRMFLFCLFLLLSTGGEALHIFFFSWAVLLFSILGGQTENRRRN